MGNLLALVRRFVAWMKLGRGQCIECGTILRDDETTRYCSEDCAFTGWAGGY